MESSRAMGEAVISEGMRSTHWSWRQTWLSMAPGPVRRPHPLGDDGLAHGAAALHYGPLVPLRRAQEDRGLLRPRGLLLSGQRLHPRSRAPARNMLRAY